MVVATTMSATNVFSAVPDRTLDAFCLTTTSTRLGSKLKRGELRRTIDARGVLLGRELGANDIYYHLTKYSQVIVDMTTPVRGCNKPDGSSLQYDLSEVRNVTTNASTKGAFEAKILIDVMNELEGKCVNMVAQCKSQYPSFTKQEEKQWITSIDQDNKIVLAHTIENADFPILFNTPRMCDPGISESKNWSLQNYIETRLYLYIYKYKNKNIMPRNNSRCSKKYIFDFRPFTFSMSLGNRRIYVNQWIEPSSAKKGFQPKTSFSLKHGAPVKVPSTSEIFKLMIQEFQTRRLGKEGTSAFREKGGLSLNLGNKTYNDFINFLKAYDGIGFDDIPPKNGSAIQNIVLTDDVIRMLYFDLIHDKVVKSSEKFEDFKNKLVKEFNAFKGDVIQVGAPGKTVVGASYARFGSILNKTRNNRGQPRNSMIIQGSKRKRNGETTNVIIKQIPALFKTFGDLAQFLYAAKYNTFVASGDRIGIAAGMYICAKLNLPVKCMIEDSVTGFVVYTNPPPFDYKTRGPCTQNVTSAMSCLRNANTKVNSKFIENGIMNTLNSTAKQVVQELERTKPRIFARTLNSAVVPHLLATNNGKRTVMKQINQINKNQKKTQPVRNYLNAIINNRNVTRAQNVKREALEIKSKLFPNNASETRNGTSISPVKINPKTNLRNFLNSGNLNRLTNNNKNQFVAMLNQKGSNLNSIKKNASNLHRVRVFNSEINKKKLSPNQYNNFVRRIKNNGNLQNIIYEAKQKAPRNFITQSGRISKKRRMNNY
jgi:hypothetical protein